MGLFNGEPKDPFNYQPPLWPYALAAVVLVLVWFGLYLLPEPEGPRENIFQHLFHMKPEHKPESEPSKPSRP